MDLALENTDGPVVVVAGDALDEMRSTLPGAHRLDFAHQPLPLGTADAVRCGLSVLPPCDRVLILNGDVPCVTPALLRKLTRAPGIGAAGSTGRPDPGEAAVRVVPGSEATPDSAALVPDVAFAAFRARDPKGYGRVLFGPGGAVAAIKEEKELEDSERGIDVVNAGLYLVGRKLLEDFLASVAPSAKQKEYLLTDVVAFAVDRGGRAEVILVDDPGEVAGINNRAELADAWDRIRAVRNRALMISGVSMPQPAAVDVDFGVTVGPDTVLEPGVSLRGTTRVGSGCSIGAGSVVVDCSIADRVNVLPYCVLESSVIGEGCALGPFAHTRTGTVLKDGAKMGNFVETKKTVLGKGSKANHLSYLGDADIGEKVNVGAGTITCNYDGYKKYRTVIEDGVFIGSDTQLVAPVKVGKDAVVAAGTTVTKDVPPGALAITRVEQVHREGYSARKRKRMGKD